MIDPRQKPILDFIRNNKECSSKEVYDNVELSFSYATLKRMLSDLVSRNYLAISGQGKGTKYLISPVFEVIQPLDIERYFESEIDEREIKENFNFSILKEVLGRHSIFTSNELASLNRLQDSFQKNILQLSENQYYKEFERLAIDLSWKSSQIEGNTYSLLETERLLKEKETAAGKTWEEATMLLNHKEALDFILRNPGYLNPLSISKIEDIHSVLTKELAVEGNLRKRRVGISGTNYKPLDNEFQILEAMQTSCDIINIKESVFEKALLALVLISYIQPFMDGNKRTARILCNAILMNYNYCPISFRTVGSMDYKKSMLLFYEQNNISAIKGIFIEQFKFAVNTYF